MARAAEMGFETLRVSGDSAKYDVAVDAGGRLWRVQVKSTMCRCGRRSYACVAHPNQKTRPYRRREFDFLAAYVIPEDLWYIIPAELVLHGRMGMIILTPSVVGHKWEPYMEAWELLRGRVIEHKVPLRQTQGGLLRQTQGRLSSSLGVTDDR